MTGRDLYVHQDGRTFLVPSVHVLAEGSLRLRRADGVEVAASLDDVAAFEVPPDEAIAFHEAAMADAVQRAGAALGALGDLLAAANDPSSLDRPPQSLDALAGLDGTDGTQARAASQALGGLRSLLIQARTDPEGLRALGAQVARRWSSEQAPEVAQGVQEAVETLIERPPE